MNALKSISLCAALLGWALLAAAEPLANAPVNPAPASTNLLAIYITQDVSGRAAGTHSTNSWASTPVLADRDFVSYDWPTHKFKITSESAKRLSRAVYPGNPTKMANGETLYDMNFPDTSFVLLASGKPVYSGMFSSDVSSRWFDCPLIKAHRVDSMFLPTNATRAVTLSIEMGTGSQRKANDARSDPRILAALKKLGL